MAITIDILEIKLIEIEGLPTTQHAEISISDGIDTYAWRRGGIDPLFDAAAVQAFLDAEADTLWAEASARAEAVSPVLTLRQEARQFLIDNPNARLLIELSGPDLETAIETRTAGGETLLLKTLSFAVRYLYEALKG